MWILFLPGSYNDLDSKAVLARRENMCVDSSNFANKLLDRPDMRFQSTHMFSLSWDGLLVEFTSNFTFTKGSLFTFIIIMVIGFPFNFLKSLS